MTTANPSAPIDGLRAQLADALGDRDGWRALYGVWERAEFSCPGEVHTRRRLYIQALGGGLGHVTAVRENAFSQPCDTEEFIDVAEAIAWVELPRSQDTYQHRKAMAEHDAYARRNDVDVDGLKGVRVDSGLNAKRQHFEVIDFDPPVGRVRITWRDDACRIYRNRRTTTLAWPEDRSAAKTALRRELERLAEASAPTEETS